MIKTDGVVSKTALGKTCDMECRGWKNSSEPDQDTNIKQK